MDDYGNIYELYTQLKAARLREKPIWDEISKYVGISVEPNYLWSDNYQHKGKTVDDFVDDPTSAISVNQAGDYLVGIMWGVGQKSLDLIPSLHVKELGPITTDIEKYYKYATEKTLYHVNHKDAGFNTALKPYSYDQFSFGTSGIGVFPNKAFQNKKASNALYFMNYGIDVLCIDEGKNGLVEYVFAPYHWKVNRIVGQFCTENGVISQEAIDRLPAPIKKAYTDKNLNVSFTIVFGAFPRDDFDPTLLGKRGSRYRGVWFMDDATENDIFFEESFTQKPIGVVRAIKIRGETFGRASGTLLLSSIRSVNYMFTNVIEILEKMANPSLGVFNNAIFGDSVLDTSADGLTVFNSALTGGSQGAPIFPIHDVGDPAEIIKFLIPYLNDKITAAFKVDALLDFSSAKEMSATESLQRYAIRGKSLAGMLVQQKNEGLEVWMDRSISILYEIGELGVDSTTMGLKAEALLAEGKTERVIPDAVLQCMREGKPWYEIRFNNELEKLIQTEAIQNLVQLIQSIGAVASLYPNIVEAVDWHKLLSDINANLGRNNQIIISADDFKKALAVKAQQQQGANVLEAAKTGSEVQKNTSQANLNNSKLNQANQQQSL